MQPQPLCSKVKSTNLTSTDIDSFFTKAQSVLIDRNNNRFKREEITCVYGVNDPDGIVLWIVFVNKNGIEVTVAISIFNR